jgi:hypothetical protein
VILLILFAFLLWICFKNFAKMATRVMVSCSHFSVVNMKLMSEVVGVKHFLPVDSEGSRWLQPGNVKADPNPNLCSSSPHSWNGALAFKQQQGACAATLSGTGMGGVAALVPKLVLPKTKIILQGKKIRGNPIIIIIIFIFFPASPNKPHQQAFNLLICTLKHSH